VAQDFVAYVQHVGISAVPAHRHGERRAGGGLDTAEGFRDGQTRVGYGHAVAGNAESDHRITGNPEVQVVCLFHVLQEA
jgi:hypothetical protein